MSFIKIMWMTLMDIEANERTSHYLHSTLRERIVKHVFVGDALRRLWQHRVTDVEVLRFAFDAGGYDLVMSHRKIVRHIQFKTSMAESAAAYMKQTLCLFSTNHSLIFEPSVDIYNFRWHSKQWCGSAGGRGKGDMQRFDYRCPRYCVDLPVQFAVQDSTSIGRCTEISQEGMRLELQQPLPSYPYGKVAMTYQNQTFGFNVRVAHVEASHHGVVFLFESDLEREAVAHLVAALAAPQDRPGLVLVKRT
jgi:PilZ domain